MTIKVNPCNTIVLPNGITFDLATCGSFVVSFDANVKKLEVSYYKLVKEVYQVQQLVIPDQEATPKPTGARGNIRENTQNEKPYTTRTSNGRVPKKIIANMSDLTIANICIKYRQGESPLTLSKRHNIKVRTVSGWASAINRIINGKTASRASSRMKDVASLIKNTPTLWDKYNCK